MFQKITYKLFEWRCLILDSHRRRPGNKDFCKQVVNLRGDFLKLWQGNGIRRGEETNQLCTNNWNLTLLRIVSACVKHTLTSHPTQGVRSLHGPPTVNGWGGSEGIFLTGHGHMGGVDSDNQSKPPEKRCSSSFLVFMFAYTDMVFTWEKNQDFRIRETRMWNWSEETVEAEMLSFESGN